MQLRFGDIVILKFPFTNTNSYKKRPALVIQDSEDGDVIFCRITSKAYSSEYDHQLLNWKEYGLKLPSVIRVHKLAALEKDIAEIKICELQDQDKQKIRQILNKLFC